MAVEYLSGPKRVSEPIGIVPCSFICCRNALPSSETVFNGYHDPKLVTVKIRVLTVHILHPIFAGSQLRLALLIDVFASSTVNAPDVELRTADVCQRKALI